jgi:hypothetical protein
MKENKSLELGTILFLIFLVLKLTNNISWSWWWVTAPLWIPVVSIILIGGIAILIGLIFYLKK